MCKRHKSKVNENLTKCHSKVKSESELGHTKKVLEWNIAKVQRMGLIDQICERGNVFYY